MENLSVRLGEVCALKDFTKSFGLKKYCMYEWGVWGQSPTIKEGRPQGPG